MSIRSLCLVLILTSALSSFSGCGGYDRVSPLAYEYGKALYSACNRRDESRLSRVADDIRTATAGSKLTELEADWLNAIVLSAQSGEWSDAASDARELMEAQVERL